MNNGNNFPDIFNQPGAAALPLATQNLESMKLLLDQINASGDKAAKTLASGLTTAATSGKSLNDTLVTIGQSVARLEKASTRGQRRGYIEHAMEVTGAIIAVAAVRPQPCYVDIYPLTALGPAGPALRAQIEAHLYDLQENELLPMGDLVTVKPPEPVRLHFRLNVTATADPAGTRAACAAAAHAVLAGWGSRLGGVVAPEDVRAAAKAVAGVVNVDSVDLLYQELLPYQFVAAADSTIHVDVSLVGGAR